MTAAPPPRRTPAGSRNRAERAREHGTLARLREPKRPLNCPDAARSDLCVGPRGPGHTTPYVTGLLPCGWWQHELSQLPGPPAAGKTRPSLKTDCTARRSALGTWHSALGSLLSARRPARCTLAIGPRDPALPGRVAGRSLVCLERCLRSHGSPTPIILATLLPLISTAPLNSSL